MKRIEAIIRPGKVSDVRAALYKVGIPGMMISEIEGHGKQKGIEQQLRGKTYKVDLLNKSKIEVVVNDNEVDNIVKTIQESAFTGKFGDGKIFVSPVENAIRISTSEKGSIAV